MVHRWLGYKFPHEGLRALEAAVWSALPSTLEHALAAFGVLSLLVVPVCWTQSTARCRMLACFIGGAAYFALTMMGWDYQQYRATHEAAQLAQMAGDVVGLLCAAYWPTLSFFTLAGQPATAAPRINGAIMGSSILTGKRAGALQKADGEWIYALFERGYESNVHPHTDSWSAVALGNYAHVMRRLFSHASSCEGGMLRSRNGSIKPENYIDGWRRELAKPSLLQGRAIDLSVGSSFYSAVPESQLDAVRLSLIRAGFESRIDELVAGTLSVSLYGDINLLLAIYGNSGPLSAWRVLKEYDCGTAQIDVPVPSASKVAMERMPQVRCHSIGRENRLIAIGSAPWRHAGWEYNAIGSFVTEVAYPIEMETPGFARKAIPAFREAVRNASPVPVGTRITVTRAPEGTDDWRIRRADELAQLLGLASNGEPAPATFSFAFGDLLNREDTDRLLYGLSAFCDSQMQWEVAAAREGAAPDPAFFAADVQLSLCPA